VAVDDNDAAYEAWDASIRQDYPSAFRKIRVQHNGALEAPDSDLVLVTASVTFSGEPIVVWASAPDRAAMFGRHGPDANPARLNPNAASTFGGSWASIRTDRDVRLVVTVAGSTTELRGLMPAYAHAQRYQDGRILLVGSRAGQPVGGSDQNALVFSSQGELLERAPVSDGVEHAYLDGEDRLWVGYSDEGVYGASSVGIVRFDQHLALDWTFPVTTLSDPNAPPFIDDCYTLNVADHAVWSSYYGDWPIVRIVADCAELVGWGNHAAYQILVDEPRVALVGYYGAPDLVRVGELPTQDWNPAMRGVLVDPSGDPLPGAGWRHARGSDLHLFIGTEWFSVSLDSIRTQIGD